MMEAGGDAILLFVEAEAFVDDLKPFPLEKIASSSWWNQQRHVEQLTMQAVASATVNEDEFIKELLIVSDKVPVLIHELITIEVWRLHILPLIIAEAEMDEEDGKEAPILGLGMALHHEATLVTLLETIFFHGDSCESAKDVVTDLIDYCHRRLLNLANNGYKTDDDVAGKSVETLMSVSWVEEMERQQNRQAFEIAIKCLSILRYICDNMEVLPLVVGQRILEVHDLPLLLAQLMQDSPWTRREGGTLRKFEEGAWRLVEDTKVVKADAQVWMIMLRVLVTGKYQMNSTRRNALMKLRPHLNPRTLDQIPPLAALCQYLDNLTFADPPVVKGDVLIQQVPELWNAINSAGEKRGWKELCKSLAPNFLDNQKVKQEALQWASTYEPEVWERLLPDKPKCATCGEVGKKRCSRCKQEWYCNRECQVSHWPKHKTACDLMTKSESEVK